MKTTGLALLLLAWPAGAQPGADIERPAPIVLAEPEPVTPGAPLWPSLLAAGAAAGLAGTAWILWRRADASDPGDASFRRMARAASLSRAERQLIRALAAAHGAASPAALLLSGHALQEACTRFDDPRRRPVLARLQRRLSGVTAHR